jgi:hypothetical protein
VKDFVMDACLLVILQQSFFGSHFLKKLNNRFSKMALGQFLPAFRQQNSLAYIMLGDKNAIFCTDA